MRVDRDRIGFPATSQAPTGIMPRDLSVLWPALVAGGGAAIGYATGGEPALVVVGGIGALVTGSYLLGRRVVRDDPRVAALTAQLDRTRRDRDAMLEYLATDGRGSQVPAPADGGGSQPPAPPAARPSASVRGGGRPGSVAAPATLRPLDATLDDRDGAATAEDDR